jgi:hypothetical protein
MADEHGHEVSPAVFSQTVDSSMPECESGFESLVEFGAHAFADERNEFCGTSKCSHVHCVPESAVAYMNFEDGNEDSGLCHPWSSNRRTDKRFVRAERTYSHVSERNPDDVVDPKFTVSMDCSGAECAAESVTINHNDFQKEAGNEKMPTGIISAKLKQAVKQELLQPKPAENGRGFVQFCDGWQHASFAASPPSPSCSPPDSPLHCASIPAAQQLDGNCVPMGFGDILPVQTLASNFCLSAPRSARVVEDSGIISFTPLSRSINSDDDAAVRVVEETKVQSFSGVLDVPKSRSDEFKTSPACFNPSCDLDGSGNIELYSTLKTTYHVAAFDFVCSEVRSRYSHILRNQDIDLAAQFLSSVSANAKSLFVRLYRRKPKWHRPESLSESYQDIDVPKAVNELLDHNLISSTQAYSLTANHGTKLRVAKVILASMALEELRLVCGVLADGKRLQSRSRSVLLPILERRLDNNSQVNPPRRPILNEINKFDRANARRQLTIDGSSPALNLARAVLRVNRINIPRRIRDQLNRIHFLFFFEEGHDSPNAILADTGKVHFPSYQCIRSSDPFPSRLAFEDYEAARSVMLTVTMLVDEYSWSDALEYGSVAELELHMYNCFRDRSSCDLETEQAENRRVTRDADHDNSCVTRGADHAGTYYHTGQSARAYAPRSLIRDKQYRIEAKQQLLHPFYRRFSPVWMYAVATWRSVRALEALRMYETAVNRLTILHEVDILTNHRGKILDRLTINLMHLGRNQESLDVISQALGESLSALHLGEVASLAKRGLRLHQRLQRPNELDRVPKNIKAKGRRIKLADDAVAASRPVAISTALLSLRLKVHVRKFLGRALPSVPDNRDPQGTSNSILARSCDIATPEDSMRLVCHSSSTHVGNLQADVANRPGVKSKFIGLAANSSSLAVEELALEWYRGHARWNGKHCEGSAVRFIWCLLFWECALYAPIPDVFQTPYQSSPWDLGTDAFYHSRKAAIDARLLEIRRMSSADLIETVRASYRAEEHFGATCVGGAWDSFTEDDLACIAGGLGPLAVAGCCELLSKDFSYWSGGLPDLVLWRWSESDPVDGASLALAKLVEVKSQRDSLSSRQRAWFGKLLDFGVDCEVFKVVEKETKHNTTLLQESDLDPMQLEYIDIEDLLKEDGVIPCSSTLAD